MNFAWEHPEKVQDVCLSPKVSRIYVHTIGQMLQAIDMQGNEYRVLYRAHFLVPRGGGEHPLHSGAH